MLLNFVDVYQNQVFEFSGNIGVWLYDMAISDSNLDVFKQKQSWKINFL